MNLFIKTIIAITIGSLLLFGTGWMLNKFHSQEREQYPLITNPTSIKGIRMARGGGHGGNIGIGVGGTKEEELEKWLNDENGSDYYQDADGIHGRLTISVREPKTEVEE